MPRIMRTGGLNVSDDVVKIRDLCPPSAPQKVKPRPVPVEDDGAGSFEGEDFEAMDMAGVPEEAGADAGFGAEFEPALADDEFPGQYAAEAPARTADVGAAVQQEIIHSAMAEASRIMEQAMTDAAHKKDEIMTAAAQEAEQLKAGAAAEGKREAFDTVVGEVKQTAGMLEQEVARFEGERAGFESEYEEQLKWMALEIAAKVLNKKVHDDDAVLTEMVDNAVQSVRNESWVRVEVAQEMTRLIDSLAQLYEGVANIEVSAVPAPPGTVQIETPSGLVDASLRTQLENLKDYFSQAQG